MNKVIATMAFSLLITACGQNSTPQTVAATDATDTNAASAEKHSGLLLEHMNTEVKPGDDFNAYVNGTWMDNTEIPSDRASNTVGLEVHENATANVRVIIEESADGDFAKGSDEQKVGDLYSSYMDMTTRNELGSKPLEREFVTINALENHTQLAAHFAELNKQDVSLPFVLAQYVDFKDPKTYMMYTYQAGLGLPDREYYFEEGERSEGIREAYVTHIEKMFDLAGLEEGKTAAATIMALETRMAAEHMKKEQTRNMVALYNKIPLDELPGLMPDFAWGDYLEVAAISDIDGLVVMQLDHMRALNEIIANTSMDDWKTYLTWGVLNTSASLLDEAISRPRPSSA
jgi:putative endopeptidase